MSELVTVQDLMTPLAVELQENETRASARQRLRQAAREEGYDVNNRYSLLHQGQKIPHWLCYSKLCDSNRGSDFLGHFVKHASEPINDEQIIGADISAMAAVQLFNEKNISLFFVSDSSDIIGTLQFKNMFKTPFKLCLFSLALEIEETALRILLDNAEESINQLGPKRLASARKIYETKYQLSDELPELLLHCTMMADKSEIFAKLELLPEHSKKRTRAKFKAIEKVRNHCAHPSNDPGAQLLGKTELIEFINSSRSFLELLKKLQR